jgi:hypothetical protein
MYDKKERTRLVEQARQYLESAGHPRLVMLSVLAVTLAAGFLASVAMVHLGVVPMYVRYPLAVAVAYATFLGLLRGWLQRQAILSQLSEGFSRRGLSAGDGSGQFPAESVQSWRLS